MAQRTLGVSTGSFYPAKTKETLARIAKLGFEQVETAIQDSELNYNLHREVDSGYFEELRGMVQELGPNFRS